MAKIIKTESKGMRGGARKGAGRPPTLQHQLLRAERENSKTDIGALTADMPLKERLKYLRDKVAIDALEQVILFSENDVARVRAVSDLKAWADSENPPDSMPMRKATLRIVEHPADVAKRLAQEAVERNQVAATGN